MNTGRKNVLGRTIWKGPRGGEYVIRGTSKLYKFTEAAPASPAPRIPTPPREPPKNTYGRIIHKGPRGGFYTKKGARKIYAFEPAHGTTMNNVRAYYAAPVAPTAAAAPSPSVRRSVSPNVAARLANIRARLNALRRARAEAIPKRRANVERRLKNALGRVRARLERPMHLASHIRKIRLCHAPASVPRKKCKVITVDMTLYDSPLVNQGVILADHEDALPTDEWFKAQNEYISSLSDYDFWTVQAHTNRSHSWIGPYLYRSGHPLPAYYPGRSGGAHIHILPLWPQVRKLILNGTYRPDGTNWVHLFLNTADEKTRYTIYGNNMSSMPRSIQKMALDMYRDDLKRIIARAPRTKRKMILYRGTQTDLFRGPTGHWHTLSSFCSTAFYLKWASSYSAGSLQRITVLPGSPVLLVAGVNQWQTAGEDEIMVNVDTKYLIRQRGVKKYMYTPTSKSIVRVTDVTIAK